MTKAAGLRELFKALQGKEIGAFAYHSPRRRGEPARQTGEPPVLPRQYLRLTPNELEPETLIVASAIMSAATGEAGGGAAQRPGAGEIAPAMRTRVNIAAFLVTNRERETVAAWFARDSEIGAGAAPLRPVRCNPAPPGARLGQKVRQLVTQCAIDFRVPVRAETTVEADARLPVFRVPGGGAQSRRPCNVDLRGERGRTVLKQQGAGNRFQR